MAVVKKAIILARVSTAGQAKEELPLESQIDVCRKKAGELGAEVVKVFVEEGVSGRKHRRDTFQEAIDYCGIFEIDYFILWNTARFARHRALAAWTKYNLRRGGTEMVYVAQNIDTSTDEGWLLEGFFELIDEQHSRTVSKDTLRSMLKNAAAGYFNGGAVPFGYAVVPDGKRKKLAVLEEEAAIVRRMFAMCLEGSGTKSIALYLNQAGLTRRGSLWTKATVGHVLKSWVYAGYLVFNRVNRATRAPRPESEWIRTKSHPAIVTEQDFERAQILINERAPAVSASSSLSRFLFTGLLRCEVCDAAMQIRTGTGRGGKVYSYYQCGGTIKGKGCVPRLIPAEAFDTVIWDELVQRLFTVERLREIAASIEALSGTWAREREAARAALVAKLRDAERRRKNLFDILEEHGRGAPNMADMAVRLRELNEELKSIERSLTELEEAAAPCQATPQSIEAVAELVASVAENAEPRVIREFLGSFVDRVVIEDGAAAIYCHPERLLDGGAGGNGSPRNPVRSNRRWLPEQVTLRTATRIAVPIPAAWRRAA